MKIWHVGRFIAAALVLAFSAPAFAQSNVGRLDPYSVYGNLTSGAAVGKGKIVGSSSAKNFSFGITNYNPANGQSFNLSNTAFGSGALNSLTNAAEFTAVGANALNSQTGGNGGVAFGSQALMNDQTGTFNTAVGSNAGKAIRNGSGSVAIGHGAMAQDDFAPAYATGDYNVAVGGWSMQELTSGGGNTALGTFAGVNLTTGASNTYVGFNAGAGGVSVPPSSSGNAATANVAVGYNALQNNTADQNVAVGYQALRANTSGSFNTAFGYLALTASVTDSANTAFGWNALAANNGGGQNLAIGYRALTANTTAAANTAIGYQALAAAVTDPANTAIGWNALASTNGSGTAGNNTAIGYRAGTANTSGGNNTFIGYNAAAAATNLSNVTSVGASSTPTASNQVVLGNSSVTTNLFWGALIATNMSAPSTPASGKSAVYVDSTNKVLSMKDDAGTVSSTVVPSTAVSNQFVTGVSAAGMISRAQPALTDLSGFGTGVATFLATPTSANLAAAVTNETGSGLLVFGTSPTITTPTFKAADGQTFVITDNNATNRGQFFATNSNAVFGTNSAGADTIFTTGAGTESWLIDHNNGNFVAQTGSSGGFKSAAPSGGTADVWKFGQRVTSTTCTVDTTKYIQLDVGGTAVKVAVCS